LLSVTWSNISITWQEVSFREVSLFVHHIFNIFINNVQLTFLARILNISLNNSVF